MGLVQHFRHLQVPIARHVPAGMGTGCEEITTPGPPPEPVRGGKEDVMSTETNRTAVISTDPAAGGTAGNTAATGPDLVPTPSPTITHHQQLADAFSRALDEIAAAIPRLEITHPTTVTFVRTHQNVSLEFISSAVAAVEQSPELQGVNKLDVTAARDTLQFIEAFRPVQDKVSALANSLKFTIASRKASLAADSLQIYSIAKGVARDPGAAAVASHVSNLRRDLGRRGRVKSAAKTGAKPATQPASPVTTALTEVHKA
jgi:hypothetical protein